MAVLLSIIFGFVPMFLFAYIIYWLDRYEKEPKILLGAAFMWGAVFASAAAFLVNTLLGMGVYLFTNSEAATNLATGSFIAPIIEETLKGIAVLIIFLFFRREFDSTLDGIVYAAVTALGFAATENAYYIFSYGYQESGYAGLIWLVIVRVFLVGWQHPFYTSFIGIGLAVTRLNRNTVVRLAAPFAGWIVAVVLHSVHNTIANLFSGLPGLVFGTFYDWTGWFFMLLFIVWITRREQQLMIKYLREEVGAENMTAAQYKTACSAWSQTAARLGALFSGKFRATNQFYQVCGELAHKKQQLAAVGDEAGNMQMVERLRLDLARLSPAAES
ncbi:MAG: PrsW family intramembrane metalloprotease [Anaerolineales bacterium]|nr:PrsW family intramembrane metalloprotease [Anaerolineales bacterium]